MPTNRIAKYYEAEARPASPAFAPAAFAALPIAPGMFATGPMISAATAQIYQMAQAAAQQAALNTLFDDPDWLSP